MNKIVQEVTEKIITRSQTTRAAYLQLMRQSLDNDKAKKHICGQ